MQLIPKKSDISGKIPQPSSLDKGEIALNIYQGTEGLYTKNNSEEIVKIAGKDLYDNWNNLQIGGTNLLYDTSDYWESGFYNVFLNQGIFYNEMKMPNTTVIRLKELLYIGSPSIISCKEHTKLYNFAITEFNENKGFIKNLDLEKDTKLSLDQRTRYIAVAIAPKSVADIHPSEISKVKLKLEAGNRYSEWSPCVSTMVKEAGFTKDSELIDNEQVLVEAVTRLNEKISVLEDTIKLLKEKVEKLENNGTF